MYICITYTLLILYLENPNTACENYEKLSPHRPTDMQDVDINTDFEIVKTNSEFYFLLVGSDAVNIWSFVHLCVHSTPFPMYLTLSFPPGKAAGASVMAPCGRWGRWLGQGHMRCMWSLMLLTPGQGPCISPAGLWEAGGIILSPQEASCRPKFHVKGRSSIELPWELPPWHPCTPPLIHAPGIWCYARCWIHGWWQQTQSLCSTMGDENHEGK